MSINHQQIVSYDVMHALAEDGALNDLTRRLLSEKDVIIQAELVNFENMLLAGCDWFEQSFRQLSDHMTIHWQFKEGDWVQSNQVVAIVSGSLVNFLSAERVALNFLQIISGVATQTSYYVQKAEQSNTGIKILDTRKTIPNMRYAQKYATHLAGAKNHRMGLHDCLMIKDNHIAALGGIDVASHLAFEHYSKDKVIIEVDHLDQIKILLTKKLLPGRLLLDNFTPEMIEQAIQLCKNLCELEISGNVNLDNLSDYLIQGVDYISVGRITKNIQSTDLSLEIK